MPKQLTTQNASITTVAVEVKALTISGKQVTLSVFRQLQEEPVISSDGTLNGVPWGYVNYHPDKCADDYPHLHVVWQQGEDLRRSRVSLKPDFDPGTTRRSPLAFESKEASRVLTSSVLEWLDGQRPDCPLHKEQHSGYNEEVTYKTPHSFPAWAYAENVAVRAANAHTVLGEAQERLHGVDRFQHLSDDWRAKQRALYSERASEATAALQAARAELAAQVAMWGLTHEELLSAYRTACAQEETRRQHHRDVRTTLAQLPQLFIAV